MMQEEEENEINLTPMLDVVFIMLIFFIVTASFIKEAGIDVDRPDAPTAESQDDAAILIAISANDEICFRQCLKTCIEFQLNVEVVQHLEQTLHRVRRREQTTVRNAPLERC